MHGTVVRRLAEEAVEQSVDLDSDALAKRVERGWYGGEDKRRGRGALCWANQKFCTR